MNILWLSHFIPYPPKGGNLQRSYGLIKELSKYHSIFLLTFNQAAILPTPADVINSINELKQFCTIIDFCHIPTDNIPIAKFGLIAWSLVSRNPYTANWTKSLQMHIAIQNAVRTHTFDIVHFDTIGLSEYLSDVESIPKKVLNHHNIESAMMLRRSDNESNLLKKSYFYLEGIKLKQYERRFCPRFDCNLVVSHLEKKILASILTADARTDIIPNGVDTDYFIPEKADNDELSLVFCGRLNAYSNESGLIRFCNTVWPLLKKDTPNLRLSIIGKNPTRKLTAIAQLTPGIQLVGYVDDVRPHISKSTIYICPLWDGGGTRLKLLDALAMGKPIVSTSIACEGIDVEAGKHLLIADSPDEWAQQIQRLICNETLREKMGENGRKLVEDCYSWVTIGNALARVYESLV